MPDNVPPTGRRLSDEDLDEFIAIYKKEFRKVLTRDDARHMAGQLIKLYALLAEAPKKGSPPSDSEFERKPESSNSEE